MRLDELKPGAVVRLNSGSIKFTVERIDSVAVHLVGYGDTQGLIRFVAKAELLCSPKPPITLSPPAQPACKEGEPSSAHR